ncbi:SH3 domain-containing C40 family peptidase [Paenibacillus hamazuiensis]|uniref:C40 family peptidase n=1 Tax=Paenibacillus hamazuiensis TaxID=2936508 RepID=UPI00200E690B|nr:SH3 domain-containing C40 family peptidase [Paenibacillus hamazuiensis]
MKRQLLYVTLLLGLGSTLAPAPSMAAYTYDVPKAKVVKTVNFRSEPSTSGTAIRYLKVGEILDVLGKPNSSWLQVKDSNGQTGYVSSSATYITQFNEQISPPANGKVIKSVSFRTGPSTDDSRIRYLQSGEPVWILDKLNSYWYKIADTNNVIGYVSTNPVYIDTQFQDVPDEPVEASFPTPPNATVVSSVSFRKAASTDSERIRYLNQGERLLVLDKTNDYWYYVQDKNGVMGYVSTSSKYISTTYVEPYKLLDPAVAAQKVIDAGMKYMGTPYEFGSSRYDTSTFDCSDFTRQAYLDGIDQLIPGDSRAQAAFVKGIGKTQTDWHQLKKGDLMFFMSYKGYKPSDYASVDKSAETVTHVGIYLGDGRVLHTYSVESGGVRIDTIAGSTWELRFMFGGATY